MMIGVNDWNTPSTPTDVYNGMVAYYNTVTTGVLQRGWEARPCIEIPLGNATLFPNCDSLRTLMRASQFLTDTGTNTGQTYDGKLKLVDFPLIQVGGVDVCNARTDALNNTYFQTDNIHPTPLLGDLMATDATNGIAARVLA
jgi:hypothetical protein